MGDLRQVSVVGVVPANIRLQHLENTVEEKNTQIQAITDTKNVEILNLGI